MVNEPKAHSGILALSDRPVSIYIGILNSATAYCVYDCNQNFFYLPLLIPDILAWQGIKQKIGSFE